MYRDKSVLNTFAKLAADEYLSHGTVLNQALKKIAKDEALTPDQIEYVAGAANQATWAHLFAADKTASYDFPLAKSAEVIKDLQLKTAAPVINDADMDFLSAPKSTKTAAFDPMEAMGFVADGIDKTAEKKELKRVLNHRMEKMAALKEKLNDEFIITRSAIEALEETFVKAARQMVITEEDCDKPAAMEKIAEFVANSGDHDLGRDLMKKLSHVLLRQGIMKQADMKAPAEYISDKVPARHVNGNHALYVTINTLFAKKDYASNILNRYEIVDSSLPQIQEKIRAL
jgi:hypothetical protein